MESVLKWLLEQSVPIVLLVLLVVYLLRWMRERERAFLDIVLAQQQSIDRLGALIEAAIVELRNGAKQ